MKITGTQFVADVDDELITALVELAAHRAAEGEPGAGGISAEVEAAFRAHLAGATVGEREVLAERGVAA